jgi:hypothetical protein
MLWDHKVPLCPPAERKNAPADLGAVEMATISEDWDTSIQPHTKWYEVTFTAGD